MTASVLIVDDEEGFLMLLGRYLTKDGFRVKTASNSLQAIDLMDQEAFDVAILDITPVDGITPARGAEETVSVDSGHHGNGLSHTGHPK
jgi:two-component system, OmpR family, response regulator